MKQTPSHKRCPGYIVKWGGKEGYKADTYRVITFQYLKTFILGGKKGQYLLDTIARYCYKCLTCINLFNSQKSPMK